MAEGWAVLDQGGCQQGVAECLHIWAVVLGAMAMQR